MDALALLCTLHADGPTTLRRLRDAGCTSLDDLGRVRADHLADLLGVSPAQGRRFLREADSLAERLGERGLEREEEPAGPVATPAAGRSAVAQPPVVAGARSSAAPARAVAATPAPATDARDLDRTDRRVLERVIERWREEEERERGRDEQRAVLDSLAAEEPPAIRPARDEVPRPLARAATGDATGAEVERDAPTGGAARLRAGAVDGLDAATCARLAELGCADLADFAARPALALARELGKPFTLVRRLQFLAARAAAAATAGPAPSRTIATTTATANTTSATSDTPVLERLSPSSAPVPIDDEDETVRCDAASWNEGAWRAGAAEDDDGPAGPFA